MREATKSDYASAVDALVDGGDLLNRAMATNATVYRMTAAGCSQSAIIVQLVGEKEELFRRVMQLESLCPKRIKMPDGKMFVWHAPDHLIPLTDFSGKGQPK